MKFSITEEKGDCLIEVTAWAGLTTFILNVLLYIYQRFIGLSIHKSALKVPYM
jgi:hypothetical protein